MKNLLSYVSIFILVAFLVLSCSTVPLTGRKQLDIIPSSSMLSLSFQQYDEFLKAHKLSNDRGQTQRVKSVGFNLQKAVEQYMTANKLSSRLKDFKWEFNLVADTAINAWCMPGGKVVVYTGILPITKNEGDLAVVMGHEIAHAIAKHGDERMSQALITELGGMALSAALETKPEKTKQLWLSAFGLGAEVGVILPYSRLQESEADNLGLIFMAMAGYDPNFAVGFWERMGKIQEGQKMPEFLSTHPSDQTRLKKIKAAIPEAMKYYKK